MRRLTALLVFLPTAALAHPGDHFHTGWFANLRHVLTVPDHLAMLGAVAVLVALVIYLRKGRNP
jgi:hydrogenase/urease accessory protein HupE